MCCGICSLWTFCNLDFLLLSTLFLLPIYGLTAGVDIVLRVSLLLSLLCILSHLLPTSTFCLQSFSQIGLIALLWSLPVRLLPYSVVWIYSLALQLASPLLLFQEVLFVIVLATDLFNYFTDLAEDDYDNSSTYNGIITALSVIFCAVASYITFTYFNQGWLPLFILTITLFNCFLMLVSQCGQLWEASFTFFISSLICLAMIQELKLQANSQEVAEAMSSLGPKDSLIEFIFGLWLLTLDKFQNLQMWLYHFMTPVFIASFFIRLFSVKWAILKMPSLSDDSETEVDVIEDENVSWLKRQPVLTCKLCTIFVLTQLICDQFYELTGHGPLFQQDWLKAWLPDQVLISRILQIALANITLQHSIYRRWQEGDIRDSYNYS